MRSVRYPRGSLVRSAAGKRDRAVWLSDVNLDILRPSVRKRCKSARIDGLAAQQFADEFPNQDDSFSHGRPDTRTHLQENLLGINRCRRLAAYQEQPLDAPAERGC